MHKLFILILLSNILLNADLIKKYYSSGELWSISESNYGVKDGLTKIYSKNGRIKNTVIYINDIRNSNSFIDYYYEEENTYTHSSGTPNIIKKNNELYTGKLTVTYRNDVNRANKRRWQELYVEDGKIIGKYTIYYGDGKVQSIKYYKNGLMEGKYISYSTNGKISMTATFKKGTLHGIIKKYYRKGALSSESNFINGKENGIHIEYWENGLISNKITMKNGKATKGTWWYENGDNGGSMTNSHFNELGLN